MRLHTRPPADDELEWCARHIEDGFEQRVELREYLPSFWRRLQQDEAITMVLIEDQQRTPAARVAFGALVFVADDVVARLLAVGRPYLSRAIVDAARRDGGYGGVLSGSLIRRHNSGSGLNVVVLHCAEIVSAYSDDQRGRIRKRLTETLIKAVAGFNIKEIIFEFFGNHDLPYLLNAGFNHRTDYAAAFAGQARVPPAQTWPHVVGLRRDEVQEKFGTRIAELFNITTRRFHFTERERVILSLAHQGMTDIEIAAKLGVGRNVVLMRWRAIFERVERLEKDFFASCDAEGQVLPKDARRRYLLRFLDDYTDELRPTARTK
jgi:DNA-binding CsgD family transcriptional regulator